MHRRIIALAAALALAVLGVTAWMAGGADATTGTCLNIATPIAQPIGCGSPCNMAIGLLRDDADAARRAAVYLAATPSRRGLPAAS